MKRLPALLCWLLLSAPHTATAEMRPVLKHRAGVPPFSVVDAMMRGNSESVELAGQPPSPSAEMAPQMVWLADCDHRVHPGLILAEPAGKVYTVCTLGNQLSLATAAIDFGVRQLFSPVLLITGQTDSEAIRFFRARPSDLGEAVRHDLALLELPPPPPKATPAEKTKGKKTKKGKEATKAATAKEAEPPKEPMLPMNLVERNVDYQVEQAVRRYQDRIASGRLVVIGGVLDLANEYGEGKNRLVLININGETDPAKLRKSPHLVRLNPSQLKLVGRRLPPPPPPAPATPPASPKPAP
ncbi:MAG TPA: carbonic anhydrase [Desulfurivibrionaceae bacterium]|nr:carbonic anhydrase [Desulfurivibrionaceae bacterium]